MSTHATAAQLQAHRLDLPEATDGVAWLKANASVVCC